MPTLPSTSCVRSRRLWLAGLLAATLAACTTDTYQSGDGRYSYLRADFGLVHTADSVRADWLLTDGGDSVRFASPVRVGWAAKADTFYRALVYYDSQARTVFSATPVVVAEPLPKKTAGSLPDDPLTIESLWVGGGFLNIGFALKTGRAEGLDTRQQLGLVLDTVTVSADGHRYVTLLLTHAQNGVPQYYTTRGYMSMPVDKGLRACTVRLSANTYAGRKTYTVEL